MCGRFSQTAAPEIITNQFEVKEPLPRFKPRYNIALSQSIAAILIEPDTTTRKLVMLRWGADPILGERFKDRASVYQCES